MNTSTSQSGSTENNSKSWELSKSETQEHFLRACIFNQLCTWIFSSLIPISWEMSGKIVKVVARIKTLNLLFILNLLIVIFYKGIRIAWQDNSWNFLSYYSPSLLSGTSLSTSSLYKNPHKLGWQILISIFLNSSLNAYLAFSWLPSQVFHNQYWKSVCLCTHYRTSSFGINFKVNTQLAQSSSINTIVFVKYLLSNNIKVSIKITKGLERNYFGNHSPGFQKLTKNTWSIQTKNQDSLVSQAPGCKK